jgi:hypothetical protein
MSAVVGMVRMMVTVMMVMAGGKRGHCSQDHHNDEQRQKLFHGRIISIRELRTIGRAPERTTLGTEFLPRAL